MNTNNTERGGWIEVKIGYGTYRCKENGGGFCAQELWEDDRADKWLNIDGGMIWNALQVIHAERTAARDRDAALAELVAKWKGEYHRQLNAAQTGSTMESKIGSAGRAHAILRCAEALELFLTNPTPHVEADRQGEAMRQMYEALKITRDIMNFGPDHQISKACEAYEALHGTEGVRA